MRKNYTSEERSELVDFVVGGSATVAEAAAQMGVATATAYSWWLRRAGSGRAGRGRAERIGASGKRRAPPPPTFVRVLRAVDVASSIEVRVGGAEIHVRRGFDGELLRGVVEALRGGLA